MSLLYLYTRHSLLLINLHAQNVYICSNSDYAKKKMAVLHTHHIANDVITTNMKFAGIHLLN